MPRAPTAGARAAAVASRRAQQDARLADLRDRLARAAAEIASGALDRATFKLSNVYGDAGISKATFYRFRQADGEVQRLCVALEPPPPPVSAVEHDVEDTHDADRIITLMQQVVTAKAYIAMLQVERQGTEKTIKGHKGSIRVLQDRMAHLSARLLTSDERVRSLERLLRQHGIDFPDAAAAASGKPDLRVVKDKQ
ncbi:hypothetical protein LQ953_09265 [Sphingomonas sp. IC-56]|uniref:hypothetical protein n=1 Tax=Sphingomonas sp. IC-56 TaxID=2898529 RepID=UPI001E451250|nr:hypothetical protein [Sphingomonas sp. IC-56]MCD2324199.1 hypothetical protein [Sphingomonas sp. IC-56]